MGIIATKIIFGEKLRDMGYLPGLYPESGIVAVKSPVFSFAKLSQVSTQLGPEMKSTGEVMGIDTNFPNALHKAFIASGTHVPQQGTLLATISDRDKAESLGIINGFHQLGYNIIATSGTAEFLNTQNIQTTTVDKLSQDNNTSILDLLKSKKIDLVINTPSKTKEASSDSPIIRQTSIEYAIPCLTSLDTARALLYSLRARHHGKQIKTRTMKAYLEL